MDIKNRKTRITTSVIGTLLGLAAFLNHGIFEIMQGNTETGGPYIEAIGEANRYWIHGTEGAFTIMPTFLSAGICVTVFSVLMILWSIFFIDSRYGRSIFLLIFILLTISGGGIGYLLLFIPTWAFSIRINKPLKWWKRVLPVDIRKRLSRVWIILLVTTSVFWLIIMELGIFGFLPGVSDPDRILTVVFVLLIATTFLLITTYISAISCDIEEQRQEITPD